jgi:hypothetical protein
MCSMFVIENDYDLMSHHLWDAVMLAQTQRLSYRSAAFQKGNNFEMSSGTGHILNLTQDSRTLNVRKCNRYNTLFC